MEVATITKIDGDCNYIISPANLFFKWVNRLSKPKNTLYSFGRN